MRGSAMEADRQAAIVVKGGLYWIGALLGASLLLWHAPASVAAASVSYEDIAPILLQHCYECHNAERHEYGLNLSTYEAITKDYGEHDIVVQGAPDASYLYLVVMHTKEPHMPPNGPRLSDENLALLHEWIAGGLVRQERPVAEVMETLTPDESLSETQVEPLAEAPIPSKAWLFLGRFHVVVLHLPIGVLIFAFLLELDGVIRQRKLGPRPEVGPLLMFGAAFALITAVLGLLLSGDPLYDPSRLFWRKWTGVAAALAAGSAALLRPSWLARGRVAYWLSLCTAMICLVIAAHLGGSLTHGSSYLTRYLPDWLGAMRGGAPTSVVEPAAGPVGD